MFQILLIILYFVFVYSIWRNQKDRGRGGNYRVMAAAAVGALVFWYISILTTR